MYLNKYVQFTDFLHLCLQEIILCTILKTSKGMKFEWRKVLKARSVNDLKFERPNV